MNFLILYEEVPDRSRIFWFKTEDAALQEQLSLCHGSMVNSPFCEDEVVEFICDLPEMEGMELLFDSNDDDMGDKKPYTTDGARLIWTGQLL